MGRGSRWAPGTMEHPLLLLLTLPDVRLFRRRLLPDHTRWTPGVDGPVVVVVDGPDGVVNLSLTANPPSDSPPSVITGGALGMMMMRMKTMRRMMEGEEEKGMTRLLYHLLR